MSGKKEMCCFFWREWSEGGGGLKTSKQIEGFLDFLREAKTDYNIAVSCEKEANDATQDLLDRKSVV